MKTHTICAINEGSRKQKSGKSNAIPSKTNKAQSWEAAAELEAAGSKIGEINSNS